MKDEAFEAEEAAFERTALMQARDRGVRVLEVLLSQQRDLETGRIEEGRLVEGRVAMERAVSAARRVVDELNAALGLAASERDG